MNMLNKVLDFFFPAKCVFCGKLIRGYENAFCCDACKDEYLFKIICCSKCSGVLNEKNNLPVCYTCRAAKRMFDAAISASRYNELMRKAIHRFKFSKSTYMAKTLSTFITDMFNSLNIDTGRFDIVVNVPPDKVRLRKKGYSHTFLLAKHVADMINRPFCPNIVEKIKSTRPQFSLSPRERAANVKGAYRIMQNADVKDKSVLLIDDVFTTGSTVSEVSKVLKRAGAKYVLVATVAKSVPKI